MSENITIMGEPALDVVITLCLIVGGLLVFVGLLRWGMWLVYLPCEDKTTQPDENIAPLHQLGQSKQKADIAFQAAKKSFWLNLLYFVLLKRMVKTSKKEPTNYDNRWV